ncbi:MAG: restriction endonuclease [Myxococcales bacterium]|nr:restriction endonuclease [Myxococcales bacterium]MCB9708600.1 restriction endonuclease [Myxococcales bacterium]
MTFTEAAVAVLRHAGRPLHYKKITELAIENNLLSHVGKTPEVTMSARLAMLAKKPDGGLEVVKVKPGVFGLKEFGDAILTRASADGAEGEDIEVMMQPQEEDRSVSENQEDNGQTSNAAPAQPESGAQLFPDEDDDDEPILAGLDEGRADPKRGRRRRRRRPGRGASSAGQPTGAVRARESGQGNGGRSPQSREQRDRYDVAGDWDRLPEDNDLIGKSLSDAAHAVMAAGTTRQGSTLERIAHQLVQKGRLQGDPQALVPTVAAALRADNACRTQAQERLRFRVHANLVWLTDWLLPTDAIRLERDVTRGAEQQRLAVRKVFLKQLRALPLTGFAEFVASWLNAEGVTSVRAIRRPGSSASQLHFAGVLHQGQSEMHLAVVMLRDGQDIDKSLVEQTRGALHHYGQANVAWLVTLGQVRPDARQEGNVSGVAPAVLFDGLEWAEALENRSIGLSKTYVALTVPQFELLAALSGAVEPDTQALESEEGREGRSGWAQQSSGPRRRRGGRGFRRDQAQSDDDGDNDGQEAASSDIDRNGQEPPLLDEDESENDNGPYASDESADGDDDDVDQDDSN